MRVFNAHPAIDDANFGNSARGIDEDEKFRSGHAGNDVGRLDIKRPVARAEQFDDFADRSSRGRPGRRGGRTRNVVP